MHDLTSLALCARARTPLVIGVIQNRGGRIFELLPLAKAVDRDVLDHIVLPHETDFSAVAPLYGVAFERARTRDEAIAALKSARARAGCTVVELVVPPHDAAELQAQALARVDAAVGRALREPGG